jgi:hypothetical protein
LFHSGAWVSYLGGGSQNLQQVTDIGNDTTNGIITTNSFVAFDDISSPDNYSVLSPNYLELGTNSTGEQLFLFGNNIQFVRGNGAIAGTFKATNVTSPNNVTLEFPNKTTGSYTIATTADIPNTSDFVEKSDFTSHSILAKQSGAGDPVAVSIGNNEILGRKSGGGSNIEGLSVSEVKSLLNYTASDVGAVATNSAITGATKTKITYDAKGLVTSGADATTADIADSSNKRYVTDANLTVIGNTSGINTGDETQSSILAKLGFVNKQQFGGTVTGTTSETIVHTYSFSANELSANTILHFETQFFRVSPSANGTFRLKLNTSNTLVGSVQLATNGMGGNTSTFASVRRKLTISGGNIIGFPPTTSVASDLLSSAIATLSNAIDVTQPLWFFVTYQPSGSGDSATCSFSHLKNF